jgi:hypothetical protein
MVTILEKLDRGQLVSAGLAADDRDSQTLPRRLQSAAG